MPKRDFLKMSDLSASEVADLYDIAAAMKSGEYTNRPLEGKTLALIFVGRSWFQTVLPPGI